MADLKVRDSAQAALMRLLAKLALLPPERAAEPYRSSDTCPIHFFAGAGAFDEARAVKLVASHLGLGTLDETLSGDAVTALLGAPALSAVPVTRWRELRTVPTQLRSGVLSVAAANPLDHENIRALEFELGLKLSVLVGREDQILTLLGRTQISDSAFDLQSLISEGGPGQARQEVKAAVYESSIFADASSPPVIRLVNKILSDAIEAGASDLHLTPESDQLAVRIRVDGLMRSLHGVPHSMQQAVTSRVKLLCGMDIAERRRPQDGRLRLETASGLRDLRISTLPTAYGESIVARVLATDTTRFTLQELGMPSAVQEIFLRVLRGSSRVVLVTGPTGSGKTSTLYAGLLELRDSERNIITVEDPIEYRVQGINQVQVHAKIGMTFAESLRSILRQDPDVVMVGEIRDQETASIAMQAAQTGHLVLSTVHTNTAAGAITRLLDLGAPAYLIASSLGAVVAQRLVRRFCQCAKPAGDDVRQRLTALGIADPSLAMSPGRCDACGGTGFRGRTAVYSVLEVNDEVRDAIRSQRGEAALEAVAPRFASLDRSALELVASGVTSLDEIERVLGPQMTSPTRAPVTARLVEPKSQPAPRGLQRRKVLLVEDDQDIRSIIRLVLEEAFYEVEEAYDGIDALEKIHESLPELIVCDINMPRLSGNDVVRKLRNDARTREVPVLMLTALDTEEKELELIQIGADDYVRKSSDKKILLARIERLLQRANNPE